MTDVPSKHVWKIKESCYVYTTNTRNISGVLQTCQSLRGKNLWDSEPRAEERNEK